MHGRVTSHEPLPMHNGGKSCMVPCMNPPDFGSKKMITCMVRDLVQLPTLITRHSDVNI